MIIILKLVSCAYNVFLHCNFIILCLATAHAELEQDIEKIGDKSDVQAGKIVSIYNKLCVVKLAYNYCMSSYPTLCVCCLNVILQKRNSVKFFSGWSNTCSNLVIASVNMC